MGNDVPVCELSDAHFSSEWPDGLIEVDKNHKIVRINHQASVYFGWRFDELIGQSVHQSLCRHTVYCDHHELACPFISIDSSSLSLKECYWVHKDQQSLAISYRIVPTTTKTLLIIFQTCDAIGFQAEELKKLSVFTEINPAPLLEVDDQGLILFSNPAMTDLMLNFGFDDEGVARVLPDGLPILIKQCLACEDEVEAVESDAFDEDEPNDHRYFLWRFHAIQNAQKRSVLLCGIDISHKKQAELQQKVFEQTIEQEKAKARKEYLAKMVHELRSPLNAVVGYATLLKQKLKSVADEKYLPLFDRIIEGGNQLAEQISLTLESSRVESGRMQADITEFEVNSLMYSLSERFEVMVQTKGLSMTTSIPDDALRIRADMNHLKQVVINLLSNAIKYTPEGQVELIVKAVDDEHIGPAIAIHVKDTGSGISEAEKEHVFGLFKRQEAHDGSDIEGDGLGLAICVEMMKLNCGRITLESELDMGSTFTAIFPRVT